MKELVHQKSINLQLKNLINISYIFRLKLFFTSVIRYLLITAKPEKWINIDNEMDII